MLLVVGSIVLNLLSGAVTGYVANDALARGRRWIVWGVGTSLFSLFALIAWFVMRGRSPVRDRPARRTAALIYAAALCLVFFD